MKYVKRYDIATNCWLVGYYVGSRFFVVNKEPV